MVLRNREQKTKRVTTPKNKNTIEIKIPNFLHIIVDNLWDCWEIELTLYKIK